MPGWAIALIVIGIIVAIFIVLYFIGRRLQKKQEEQDEQVQKTKQPMVMLIIDKKRMPLNKADLPPQVLEGTPKMFRRSKVPVVRVKVGPQITNMIADDRIFDEIPVKRQVRAMVSGIYIVDVRDMKGHRIVLDESQKKKRNWLQRQMDKISRAGGATNEKKK
ncbi:MAG TPA: hypothetical protein DGX96_08700 [Lachnospiraceae bacterium]|jgi:hypothetical protein|nr:hypothetical protein [Lachnospiraceae bacterium]